jgi:outer membrane protein OmpA-like peptidoglycan-associated protein
LPYRTKRRIRFPKRVLLISASICKGLTCKQNRLAPALLVPDTEFNYAQMRDLANDLRNARRLSVSFRFQRNSAALDYKARQDISRLARFLKSDAVKFKEVLLLGFTDNTGSFDANLPSPITARPASKAR